MKYLFTLLYCSFLCFSFSLIAQTTFEEAVVLFEEQKYETSEKIFTQIVQQDTANYKSIEYLGDIASHQKKWNKAIENYTVLKNKFPKNATYHYKYGGALAMKAKNSNFFTAFTLKNDIEKAFLTSSLLDTSHIDVRWALVMFYIQLPAIAGGSEKKAQQYAKELYRISKVDGYLAYGYIATYFKRYKNAEENYVKAHKIGYSVTTFKKLSELYIQLNATGKLEKLKKSISLYPLNN